MKNLLAPRQAAVLQHCLESNPLLAFDYDGTLSPIVKHPHKAGMRPRTRALLTELARLRPCAVISGRMRSDLAEKLKGVPLTFLIGNHGMEWARKSAGNVATASGARSRREASLVRSWLPDLNAGIVELPGVWLEVKNFSITVHYRASPHPIRARKDLERKVRRLPKVRVIGGKFVLNLVPREAMDKGQAVLRLVQQERFGDALYVGDDMTDENVFRVSRVGGKRVILGVRIGRNAKSRAEFFLEDQRKIDRLLSRLVAFYSPVAPSRNSLSSR